MSEPKTMQINNIEYVRKDSLVTPEIKGEIKIVILHRGWALVGRLERSGSNCKLHNAAVIRKWGTARGLGEIAVGGPTPNTKLDKTNGLVQFDYLTVEATIDCEESKWQNVL